MSTKLPTYFISHGGGPWPWVENMRAIFTNLEASFVEMAAELGDRPKAVLMISGHWETHELSVMSSTNPPMEYDYSGFPPHTYEVVYGAPGAPELADRVAELLTAAGISSKHDDKQGYDHGTFVPMAILYPKANMPLIQLSILKSYDPEEHLRIGRALAPLRDEGILIVGSGLSYHNLRLFGPEASAPSNGFDAWLSKTLSLDQAERTAALMDWEKAPYARICHPQEDHLVPLFVALGAAEGETATRTYHDVDIMGGVTASSYKFGA